MPFTPFHMGPGLLIKAVLQGSFSLMVFGWSQIVMDLQPLLALLSGNGQLHGFTHTYIGATGLALFAALTGKVLAEFALRSMAIAPDDQIVAISWRVAILSAFVGTVTHVILDSMMHSDMQPLYPFFETNILLEIISTKNLHKFCIYSGLIGAGLYFGMQHFNKRRSDL